MGSFIGEPCTYETYNLGKKVEKTGVIISGPDLAMTQDEPRYYFLVLSAGLMITVGASCLVTTGTEVEKESEAP